MDQRLTKALEYADYVTTFKNQKRVLLEKFKKYLDLEAINV